MIAFLPDTIDETSRLKNILDDHVAVRAETDSPLNISPGEAAGWVYSFQKGGPAYSIHSGDKADIDHLRLFGNGHGADVTVSLGLHFAHGSPRLLSWRKTWKDTTLNVVSENDVLGVLRDKVFSWFEIRVAVDPNQPPVSLQGIEFCWEAGDIETHPFALADLIQIEGIGISYRQKLAQIGLTAVEHLLYFGADAPGRESIVQQTGISEKLIARWVCMADLFRINGVGEQFSELLYNAGITSVEALAAQHAGPFYEKLEETNRNKKLAPTCPSEIQVKSWIIQAQSLPVRVK